MPAIIHLVPRTSGPVGPRQHFAAIVLCQLDSDELDALHFMECIPPTNVINAEHLTAVRIMNGCIPVKVNYLIKVWSR